MGQGVEWEAPGGLAGAGHRGCFHPGVKATAKPPRKEPAQAKWLGGRCQALLTPRNRTGKPREAGLVYPTGARPLVRRPSLLPVQAGMGCQPPRARASTQTVEPVEPGARGSVLGISLQIG